MTFNFSMQNYLTTIGGLLAGLPILIVNSGIVLTPKWQQVLAIIGGLGTLLIGLAAKDFTTHSTQQQVAVATAVKAADDAKAVK